MAELGRSRGAAGGETEQVSKLQPPRLLSHPQPCPQSRKDHSGASLHVCSNICLVSFLPPNKPMSKLKLRKVNRLVQGDSVGGQVGTQTLVFLTKHLLLCYTRAVRTGS